MPTNPLIGRGTTLISSSRNSGPPLGECRDAGIDFNIPLPPMLSEAGREFDIILVMDAGASSSNAHELQRAVDLGYLDPMTDFDPEKPFKRGQFVRVFHSNHGGPSVIYFLGLCERGTHQIICPVKRLLFDVSRLREKVQRQLIPAMVSEVKRFLSKKQGIVAQGPVDAEYEAMNEDLEDVMGADDEEEFLPPEIEQLSEEVRTIMVAAAATGSVLNEYDAFMAAENVILFENTSISEKERKIAIFSLETVAVLSLFGNRAPQNPLENLNKDLKKELLYYGVCRQGRSDVDGTNGLVLTEPFADFYAATALVSQVVRQDIALLKLLRRDGMLPSCSASLSSVPLHLRPNLWNLLAIAFRSITEEMNNIEATQKRFYAEVFTNFERFLIDRQKWSDQDKEAALTNFANTVAGSGMSAQLLELLKRQEYSMTDGERVKVSEAAARTACMDVLRYMAYAFPKCLDQASVLAAAYGSTDSAPVDYLKKERKLRLDFVDACRLGYTDAVSEMGRQPENTDHQKAALAALEARQEGVCNILYQRGTPPFRAWLGQEVQKRQLPWKKLLDRVSGNDKSKSSMTH